MKKKKKKYNRFFKFKYSNVVRINSQKNIGTKHYTIQPVDIRIKFLI